MNKMLIFSAIILILVLTVVLFLNQTKFGHVPHGARLARIEQSPNYRNGQFYNQTIAHMSMREALLALKSDAQVRPTEPISTMKTDLCALDRSENCIVWFGHSSYFIQSDGVRILVDPVFCTASPVGFINKPFAGTDLYTPDDMPDIDLLIITHDHWDHLDYETVNLLRNRIANIVCPLGVGEHFEYWGFNTTKIIELDWYEKDVCANVMVHCRPTMHFSGRGLKRNKSLWASFVVQTAAHTFFIGGDGGYGLHFAEVGRDFPNIDYAFVENGQYNAAWSGIHIMPEFLESVANDLQARHIIMVHHSKYALARHAWDEPLHNTEKLREHNVPVLLPMIGEKIDIK